jgi:MFS family permease
MNFNAKSAECMSRGAVTDSSYSWVRLAISVLVGTFGASGMWSVVVVLPSVQADFGVARADASLPYTVTMLCFALGGVIMGRLSDRYGIVLPLLAGTVLLSIGYVLAAQSTTLLQFAIVHGALIGTGAAAAFAPLIADISHWFVKRRGIAVALCASGNYLGGTAWPPIVQYFLNHAGWRPTYVGIGIFCAITMLPLIWFLKRKPPVDEITAANINITAAQNSLGLSPRMLQALLTFAGLCCCVAMSMPQVHIVAYCGDLGYGVARGAEMLSLMLGFGIVSRVASGFIADRMGGVPTLLLGSALQGLALVLYTMFDGLTSLYLISALFGLFQGGIVPSYAFILREYFPANEAGGRLGVVIMATLFGMALGGWISGAIFDFTGSYRAAFVNGLIWNILNISITLSLLWRQGGRHERKLVTASFRT